jgi:hypothetical protein
MPVTGRMGGGREAGREGNGWCVIVRHRSTAALSFRVLLILENAYGKGDDHSKL